MKDRNMITALVLIGLILLLTPTYMRLVNGPQTPTEPGPQGPPATGTADTTEAPGAPEPLDAVRLPRPREPMVAASPDSALPSHKRVIRTPSYTAVLEERGAAITEWRLHGFVDGSGEELELLPPGARTLVAEIPDADGRIDTGTYRFSSTAADTITLAAGERAVLELVLVLEGDRRLVRRMTFSGDTFDMLIEDRLEGFSVSAVNDRYRLWWRGGLRLTEGVTERARREEIGYSGFYALQGGDVHRTKLKNEAVESRLTGRVDWAAVRTKYFAAILLPEPDAFDGARMTGVVGALGPAQMEMGVEYPLESGSQTCVTTVYLGPLDYHTLRDYRRGLQKMMDFGPGVIRPIGKLILNLFTWMHGLIPNYGIVIIIFSVLVKLAVFPLTRKSYESMHAMQELAPKMQEIRERYKEEPEKLNKKMMNLYKEHKVNPLGGCFPMLLQMPIFFALFSVFRSTIELRGAPFVLWLTDLSAPDPYLVLPGIMALSQFIQQRMQMKDPRQKAMVYILPLVMFFIFRGFSAGLVLYWTMFNVLSVVQTELIHPKSASASPPSR